MCARLVKVCRELVLRRPTVHNGSQFYEVVEAFPEGCEGCWFQQEELDDEEADLKCDDAIL